MLGFGALGEFALGEGPFGQTRPVGSQWQTPIRKAGLTAAVVATTFVGFVPPPPVQAARVFTQFSAPQPKKAVNAASWQFVAPPARAQTAIFSAFSQPQFNRVLIDEVPSSFFEPQPPPVPPFTGFAKFDLPIQVKFKVALYADRWWQPITLPVDTHDGVFVKRKKKRHGPDPIDLELEKKAKRRAALELAVYGPEPEIPAQISPETAVINSPPVDVTELARAILAAQQAQVESIRAQEIADEEDDLESILREIL